mgnify:CR=1 FL=1
MPSRSIIADTLSLVACMSLPECEGVLDMERYWRWPCGFVISQDVVVPGSHWVAIQNAHQAHHDARHKPGDWCPTETVETRDTWVKHTYSCYCKDADC